MEIYKALGTFVGQQEGGDEHAARVTRGCFQSLLTLEGPHRMAEAAETFQAARKEAAEANTPSALLRKYDRDERVPGNTFTRSADLIDNIVAALSGKEWNADTVDVIAELLTDQGYVLKGVENV